MPMGARGSDGHAGRATEFVAALKQGAAAGKLP
jgi:hypothetical protein